MSTSGEYNIEDTSATKSESKVIMVPSNQSSANPSRMSMMKSRNWLVEVDRKISVFQWMMIVTAPFVNPIVGVFLIVTAIKHIIQKKNGDRRAALKSKAYFLGLAQWAWRLSITFAIIFGVLFTMNRYGRFPGI